MATPYRSSELSSEPTPLRRSWWDLAMSILLAGYMGVLAYALFRYVAAGIIGYAIAALVAILAVLFAREIGQGKLGTCPRCGTPIEVGIQPHGYQCPSCKTFVDVDRDRLILTPESRVAKLFRFGVEADGALVLPDCCCVCLAKTTRHTPTTIHGTTVDVPYCAEHVRGVAANPNRRAVSFRSLGYATRTCEASHGRLVGPNRVSDADSSMRWFGLVGGGMMLAGAAASYWGLAALEHEGYVIVPTGPKGLVLWVCLKLLGRLWVTAILATLAAGLFGMFLGSFKPRRR